MLDIMNYSNKIWATADILRSSVGLKESDWPSYMMPFFALRMIESRLLNQIEHIKNDENYASFLNDEGELYAKEYLKSRFDLLGDDAEGGLYNDFIVDHNKTLMNIVQNDKCFTQDFENYLGGFSPLLQNLLGVNNPSKADNMNLEGIINDLKNKQALFGYVKAWAEIDLSPYNNAEITTLEEHIKHRWADMSADTAGEQYTPYDIISLISKLILTNDLSNRKVLSLYDMTCGGGNMLFGVADKLAKQYPDKIIKTYGQELNGSLYALAKIESMFRENSKIKDGNTLTDNKFLDVKMDFVIANPPYGTDWKQEEPFIKSDTTGRFIAGLPTVGDGQLLFVENGLYHIQKDSSSLHEIGQAYIVLNGSPMFSGGAGSSESEIRKYILDNDYLDALIQLPTNEFFNTGIQTYIWCLNTFKTEDRKNKVLLINAEDMHVGMKKSLNQKSKQISEEQSDFIATLFQNKGIIDGSLSPYVKDISKYDLYFNHVDLKVTETDDDGSAIREQITLTDEDIETILICDEENTITFNIADILSEVSFDAFSETLKDVADKNIAVILKNGDEYAFTGAENSIDFRTHTSHDYTSLGKGQIAILPKKKNNKKSGPSYKLSVIFKSIQSKETEIVKQFSPNNVQNDIYIREYLNNWVSENEDNYEVLSVRTGVEVNFNAIFGNKYEIKTTAEIKMDLIANLAEMTRLQQEILG